MPDNKQKHTAAQTQEAQRQLRPKGPLLAPSEPCKTRPDKSTSSKPVVDFSSKRAKAKRASKAVVFDSRDTPKPFLNERTVHRKQQLREADSG